MKEIKSLRECRTFADLMNFRKPYDFLSGSCRRCGASYVRVANWHYSTRASICEPCAIKARDELLPRVANAERKARRWVKARDVKQEDTAWISSLTGASQSYVRELIVARIKSISEARVKAMAQARRLIAATRRDSRS